MICEKHNRFYPTRHCPQCIEDIEKEIQKEHELRMAIKQAEFENSQPIILWEGN